MSNISFDFQLAKGTVGLLEKHSVPGRQLRELTKLPAIDHLMKHQNRFGFGPVDRNDLLSGLILPLEESRQIGKNVRRAIDYLEKRLDHSTAWLREVKKLLPPGHRFENLTVYLTFGYDLGVVSDEHSVSLNLAHPQLYQHPEDIEYYLMHEVHHAGYLHYQNPPVLREIKTRREFRGAVMTLTHMEGMGMLTPLARRQKASSLQRDPKYRLVFDLQHIAALVLKFWRLWQNLDDLPNQLTTEDVRRTLENFGSPDQLLHLVGLKLAMEVQNRFGTSALVNTIEEGPERFFALCRPDYC